MSHDTQVKQGDRELIESVAEPWICVEEPPCEEAESVHWEEMVTSLTEALATVRREAQTSFVNNIAAILEADDVEAFTALIMKAKASPDLNSETRSALKSEAEIRREEREAAFKDAIEIAKDFQTMTRPNFYGKYKVTTLMAALEASAGDKGEMNGRD